MRPAQSGVWPAILGLAILNAALYLPWVLEPGPLNDDWLTLYAASVAPWGQRISNPFRLGYDVAPRLLNWLSGSDPATFIQLWTLSNALLQTASAILLWASLWALRTLRPLPPSWPLVAVGAAALFAVYPTDQARFWLSSLSYRLAMAATLLSLFCVLLYARERRPGWLWVALASTLIGISSQEQLLPLLLVVPAGVAVLERGRIRSAFGIGVGVWASILAIWPLASIWALENLFGSPYGKSDLIAFDLSNVVEMPARALVVTFVEGWRYAFRRVFRIENRDLIAASTFFLVLIAGWFLVVMDRPWRFFQQENVATERPVPSVASELNFYGTLFAIGGLLVVWSYVVLIPTRWEVSLGSIDSRINGPATIGAALSVASGLMAGALAVMRRPSLAIWVAGALLAGAGSLGAGQVRAVGRDYRLAWETQRMIWRDMVSLAPDIQDDTFIVIAGVPRSSASVGPLASPWEVTAALRGLYGNPTLLGDVLFAYEPLEADASDRTRIRFLEHGILTRDADPQAEARSFALEQLLLLRYDPGSGRLLFAQTLPGLDRVQSNQSRIRATPAPPNRIRTFVER